MEAGLLDALLEYGSMGLFAAFLVWQHLSMQKRFDKLYESFKAQLKDTQEKYEANEEKLRERYDSVIRQYQDDKDVFREDVATQISNALKNIDSVKEKMDTLPFDTIQIQIEAVSLNQRNSHLLIEKGMDIIRNIQEDAKIKAMARKLNKNNDE